MADLLLGLDLAAVVRGALVLTSKFSLFFFFLALERERERERERRKKPSWVLLAAPHNGQGNMWTERGTYLWGI